MTRLRSASLRCEFPAAYRGCAAIFHDLTAGVTNSGRSIVKSMANIGISKECLAKLVAPRGWNSVHAATHLFCYHMSLLTFALAKASADNILPADISLKCLLHSG